MLARREAVTARSLATAAGTSTTALYTYFGGMDGLWRAVRQEGFARLAETVTRVAPTSDPIRDLAAYGIAYLESAIARPDLYRAMFDAAFELDDPAIATTTFDVLVDGATRAKAAGRFGARTDARALATRLWTIGHGLASLVASDVIERSALRMHAPEMSVALFVSAGDEPRRCRRSVNGAWAEPGVRL
jgi:AcrR family transcriptional regulator